MHPTLLEALEYIRSETYDTSCDGLQIAVPHNIVCTATLCSPDSNPSKAGNPRRDLRKPSRYMLNAKRNESEFAAFKTKYRSPSATTLTFPTDKMVCIGANTPAAGEYALHRSANDLQPHCQWECFRNFSLNNVVCSSKVGHYVDIGRLAAKNQSRVKYDPTRFPGAQYETPPLPGVPRSRCVMIFEAGAFNIMGIVSLRELIPIMQHVRSLLANYATTPRGPVEDIVQAREEERLRHFGSEAATQRADDDRNEAAQNASSSAFLEDAF